MYKKYYDENNYIVGTSCGEITDNFETTSARDCDHIKDLLHTKPERKGYITYIKETINPLGISNYEYAFERIPENELSDEELKELFLQEILNSIVITDRPANKVGYHLVPSLNGTSIVWNFVPDKNNGPKGTGDYLDPFIYTPGMEVFSGMWYTDGDNIWEAISTGTPENFNDVKYFDIIK